MQDDTRKRFFSSSDQTWATPPAFFKRLDDVFHFKLDPCASSKTAKCAKFFTKEDDGLKQDWATIGNTFVNPPFGRELPAWIEKSYDEAQGGAIVAMLIPARPDTLAWHKFCLPHAKILFIRGRIVFEDQRDVQAQDKKANPAFFPSALVVFGKTEDYPLVALNDLGTWMTRWI